MFFSLLWIYSEGESQSQVSSGPACIRQGDARVPQRKDSQLLSPRRGHLRRARYVNLEELKHCTTARSVEL